MAERFNQGITTAVNRLACAWVEHAAVVEGGLAVNHLEVVDDPGGIAYTADDFKVLEQLHQLVQPAVQCRFASKITSTCGLSA